MSFYETLGVDKNASLEAIKQSYHKLALQHHPDRTFNANESKDDNKNEPFLQIQEAYEILSDAHKKKQYDVQIKQQQIANNSSISYHVKLTECELIDTEKDDSAKVVSNVYEYP
eukprot:CAMPEP_0202720858 /NCGR_PEP_ID=MMETSP1385-20130828/143847_1 /ASSEMBLY_ACC=CAM_ASM_000861 /TAXON_ID=933848 /ORGANISM="Elphidium margaritaceum" /LENGTH=113 /DNA_ID=CAMNT_0049384801 /DNA_START=21 /DNA_END=359 /DNA_ORIENTATION=-